MITEPQIEEYFRAKVEEFRARGVPVNCISADFQAGFSNPRLLWHLHADPRYCVVAKITAEAAFEAIVDKMGIHPTSRVWEHRAQAQELLKSADELEGKK